MPAELFPNINMAYNVGPIPIYGWNQAQNQSTAWFTDSSFGCQPTTLQGESSPMGGGAFFFNILNGSSNAAPTQWTVPPSRCNL